MSSLSFTFIGNACGIFTGSKGTRVLCDPWLVDGVFEGSWCHYPPVRTRPEDLLDVDAIYVSHLHPDHFDERFFPFSKSTPIIVLDHGPNFLLRKIEAMGFSSIISLRDGEVGRLGEIDITMYAPFVSHPFHDAEVGNLIDSAALFECMGVKALNTNDNTPSLETCDRLVERHGRIDLAMINYNAAGPYPSCFNNLTHAQKTVEHMRVLSRNISHMRDVTLRLNPRCVLPFAGAYVLGGDLWRKNAYLGTTTWDVCGRELLQLGIGGTGLALMREGQTLDLDTMTLDSEYTPIDEADMDRHIVALSSMRYPHQLDPDPDEVALIGDLKVASHLLTERMARRGLKTTFSVAISVGDHVVQVLPEFSIERAESDRSLHCKMDLRLLRRILDRKSHWNNAEIGAHIDFVRKPNEYEPDLHTALQFLHL
jgi:UDP-MurNAc hydroxylase